ncbi:MAG: ATP-binding cassette domain-containing protein, partial [Rickettsiales bacterium]|nr:ATP-binding cassette domain-containing protein [Rickettsiales bacterium]
MTNILKSLSKVSPKGDVVLSVRDIKKTFMEGGQPLHILRGGGFDLRRGEIVAMVGPSGCGKSTLLQCVGLLDKPSGGSILLSGTSVQKMDDEMRTLMRRRKIGFVYQRHNLLSDFTALENVVLPMLANGVDEDTAESRAKQLLKSANVLHRGSHL